MSLQAEKLTFGVTEDKGPAIAAISSKLTAIAAALVFSRLFVRVKVQKRLFCDDFWTVLSMAGAALSHYFLTQAVDNGSGRHITEIDPSQLSSILRDTTFGFIGGILTLGLLKITIVSLLLRVLAPKRMLLTLTWSLGVVSGLSLLAMALMTLFQCSPIDAAWNFGIDAVCWPLSYVLITGYWSGAVSILANFAYLAIPAITLRRTQLSLLKEAGLGLALGVGLLPVAAGVIRTAKLGLLGGADPIFNFCDLLYWTSIEANLTIMAVCVPAFQPLLERKKERESGIFGEAQHLPAGDEKHGRRALNLFNTVVDSERKA